MFGKSFCVILVLCGCVSSAEYISGTSIKNVLSDAQMKQHKFPKAKVYKITPIVKNSGARIKTVRKRGIVMVDSDFDIPSEIYTYENNLDDRDIFEKNEGSGMSENDEEPTKDAEGEITLTSELQKVTNISISPTQSTIKIMKPTTEKTSNISSTNIEGSGDESPTTEKQFISTKEMSTESYTPPEFEIQEKISGTCMNSTCDTTDLFIFTSEERTNVAEGTNLTLMCKSNNHSLHTMLHLYKSNGSEYFLQTLGTNAQLHLNIPNTKLIHTGTYVCVKRESTGTCCNIKFNLIIYEVPLYQYHFIIIGIITLAGIVLCIFLSVRQSAALKKYTKEFAEKHGNMKNLL